MGFVAGGLAVLIMLIWVGTALVISTVDSRSAKDTAAESLKTVTTLAITAQQARADETLSLIRRGDEDVRKQSYYQRIDAMQQQLALYLAQDDSIDKTDLAPHPGRRTETVNALSSQAPPRPASVAPPPRRGRRRPGGAMAPGACPTACWPRPRSSWRSSSATPWSAWGSSRPRATASDP